jgi:DNA-binding GntR family transcriptional regulator
MADSPGGRIPAKYREIADYLRAEITEGRLKPGDKLPGQAVLMREFGVAMATVVRALDELRKEGRVETQPGIGTTVLEPPKPGPDVPAELAGLRSEVAELREQGRAPDAELLERLGAVEAALMDLYAKSGYEYPGHAPERGKRKAAGK